MSDNPVPTKPLQVVGFYLPRQSVDWTGEIINLKTGELVKEESMTKQSFKEECDINTIVKRFEATGQVDHINQAFNRGLFEDLPDGLDLQSALNQVQQAQEAFMALPAHVRSRFDNDPVKFVEFFHDPANQEEAIELGLARDLRPPPTPPSPASSTPPAPPAGKKEGE